MYVNVYNIVIGVYTPRRQSHLSASVGARILHEKTRNSLLYNNDNICKTEEVAVAGTIIDVYTVLVDGDDDNYNRNMP